MYRVTRLGYNSGYISVSLSDSRSLQDVIERGHSQIIGAVVVRGINDKGIEPAEPVQDGFEGCAAGRFLPRCVPGKHQAVTAACFDLRPKTTSIIRSCRGARVDNGHMSPGLNDLPGQLEAAVTEAINNEHNLVRHFGRLAGRRLSHHSLHAGRTTPPGQVKPNIVTE
jgi:hypothetical protein